MNARLYVVEPFGTNHPYAQETLFCQLLLQSSLLIAHYVLSVGSLSDDGVSLINRKAHAPAAQQKLCPEPHTIVDMEAAEVGQRTAEALACHFGGHYLINDCDCTEPPHHPNTR